MYKYAFSTNMFYVVSSLVAKSSLGLQILYNLLTIFNTLLY